MCTRFHLEADREGVGEMVAAVVGSRLAGRFLKAGKALRTEGDARPTDVVPVVAPGKDGRRAAFAMQWGFRMPGGGLVVNARVETAARKASFSESWLGRRCAVPAAWYYEWEHRIGPTGRKVAGDKFIIRPAGGAVAWLCGLYRMEGEWPVFAVLTRAAAGRLAEIHDRMPLVLPGELLDEWIRPGGRPEALAGRAVTEMVAEREAGGVRGGGGGG